MEENENRQYPYDTTPQTTTSEHEQDIIEVINFMKSRKVELKELPEFVAINQAHNVKVEGLEVQLNNARHLIKLLRDAGGIFYENMKDNTSAQEAWEWAKNNLTEEMREELDISCPRVYRIVDVTLSKKMRLAVPEDWSDYQTEELATDVAENCDYEYESDELRSHVDEDDLNTMRIDNDTGEFDDSDFE